MHFHACLIFVPVDFQIVLILRSRFRFLKSGLGKLDPFVRSDICKYVVNLRTESLNRSNLGRIYSCPIGLDQHPSQLTA
jgi:hypothetical protein